VESSIKAYLAAVNAMEWELAAIGSSRVNQESLHGV
jgi:hypothetical protein